MWWTGSKRMHLTEPVVLLQNSIITVNHIIHHTLPKVRCDNYVHWRLLSHTSDFLVARWFFSAKDDLFLLVLHYTQSEYSGSFTHSLKLTTCCFSDTTCNIRASISLWTRPRSFLKGRLPGTATNDFCCSGHWLVVTYHQTVSHFTAHKHQASWDWLCICTVHNAY